MANRLRWRWIQTAIWVSSFLLLFTAWRCRRILETEFSCFVLGRITDYSTAEPWLEVLERQSGLDERLRLLPHYIDEQSPYLSHWIFLIYVRDSAHFEPLLEEISRRPQVANLLLHWTRYQIRDSTTAYYGEPFPRAEQLAMPYPEYLFFTTNAALCDREDLLLGVDLNNWKQRDKILQEWYLSNRDNLCFSETKGRYVLRNNSEPISDGHDPRWIPKGDTPQPNWR